jgi:D-alanyl-lipoteichoic acid acyltransferase DltB (MBOAT superfamily)
MTFNSIPFLIFYPIVLLGYFASRAMPERVGKHFRWVFLLLASYGFYMYTQPMLIFLILFTTAVSWISSLVIENINLKLAAGEISPERTRKAERQKKLCLTMTLVTSLGVLFFFKYFNFLCESVLGIAGMISGEKYSFALNLILPVGISFYTFQTLSYAIDVYRGDIKTERHFGYYALFVTFFPQLVAGPIERPDNLLPQLKERLPISGEDVSFGLRKMALGFFKKIVVADLISVYVNSIYNGIGSEAMPVIPALGVIIATVLFAAQIYCDFSGYTDIAIGCSRIMGIRLMKNFDHPYIARSVKEFWNRWHLSLSTWFRDYLYFPLGGSRCSRAKHMRNIMIVFLVSGFWHGAAWTYVIWGVLHGLFQIIGSLTIKARNALWDRIGLSPESRTLRILRTVGTFVLVDFTWLFFRANNTTEMMQLLSALVSPESWSIGLSDTLACMGLTAPAIVLTVLSVLTLSLLDRMVLHHDEPGGIRALSARGAFITVTWIIIFAWTYLMANDMTSTFIYFQF